MFTLAEIDEIHERLGNAETLREYVQALAALGVERYDSYLADGHSEYFGRDGSMVASPAAHETLVVAETSSREGLLEHLKRHEAGETDYVEMSRGLAESGVEKWTVDTGALTMTFRGRDGEGLLVEEI